MRLFVALALPPQVQEHLDLALAAVGDDERAGRGAPTLRWVAPGLRHITLAFYGEVPGGAVPDLTADLADVAAAHGPLRLQVRGAGVFAGRTLWAGVREVDPPGGALVRLMTDCEDLRHPDAARRERHRAHVTLARARRPDAAGLDRRAQVLSVYSGPTWLAEDLELLSSELGAGKGGAPVHEVIARLPLGGPAPAAGFPDH